MNLHRNARTTPFSRAEMVRRVLFGGETGGQVAAACATTVKTVGKWVDRYQQQGLAGLEDRSSSRARLPGKQIAQETGTSRSTVSRYLRAAKLSRARDLEPAEPVVRYERKTAGELIHLDIKKLGRFDKVGHRITGDRTRGESRGAGWEFVHVCIDDASRVAFSQIWPDERKQSAVAFLKAAVAYYASLGVSVSRVMTDNGSAYRSKAFAKTCKALGLKHIFTKPYTPKTNGKAERFIQTALREWAYAKAYPNSDSRAGELPAWVHRYNWHRPHGGINSATPISRLSLTANNLLRLHI